MHFSINHYYGEQSSKCGYCKGTNCSIANGMHSFTMNPMDYQDLIDRGWRRCGHYLYKPDNKKTCCPLYTIKCDALEFKLSKSHKKILKRMNRFLRDGKKDKNEEQSMQNNHQTLEGAVDDGGIGGSIAYEPRQPKIPIPEVNLSAIAAANPEYLIQEAPRRNKNNMKSVIPTQTSCAKENPPITDVPNPPCKKAKQMRLERKQAKLAAKGIDISTATMAKKSANQEKTLSDFFNDTGPNDKHKLKIVLVPANKLEITDEALSLYRKYQIQIHNDSPNRLTPASLKRFLYSSPLKHFKTADGPPDGCGSFHQQYWLDDKLIAVAVIDILPYCISSVYFFYDPDYSFLSLGTYGSLREIEMVQQLSKIVPTLKYYYMGFYIHTCPKMRYKGKLVPSYLLCPETYKWVLLTDEIRANLDVNKYQRFNSNAADKDDDRFQPNDIDKVLLLVENTKCILYRTYIQSSNFKPLDNMLDIIRSRIYKKITGDDDDRDSIIEYGKLVGKSCAHRMLYWIVN